MDLISQLKDITINGGVRIIIEIVLVLLVTIYIAKTSGRFIKKTFQKKSRRLNIDDTQFTILRRLLVFCIYTGGILFAASLIPGMSALGTSLLASAGILAVVFGFAAQHTFANIISGIFIALFEPFRVGDKVQIGEEYGTVEDITLRHTIIKTWQEKRIVIANSKISEESIINYSLYNPRMLGTLDIGISYDSDIDKARKIMIEEANKHPDLMKEVVGDDNAFLSKEELVLVRMTELTDFTQNMRLYFWAPDKTTSIKMKFDLTEAIKKRLTRRILRYPSRIAQ